MTEKYNVLVLGYGEMGHAMKHLLDDRHNVFIWEKFPVAGFISVVLEEAVPDADFILFCLPVNPHREVIRKIEPMLTRNSICVSIAKGLDESGQTAAQIFADVLADRHEYALVYGPMISEEIRSDRFAFAQVGCRDKGVYDRVSELFSGTMLLLEYTSDIAGISWAVILKNVYAILFGVADELRMGDNVRGYLVVHSVTELNRIVELMGGDPGASSHLAGLGDLVTTATSEGSHHHELGRLLVRGELQAISGEGIHTLAMVEKYRILDKNDFPLFSLIYDIIKAPESDIKERIINYLMYAH